MLYRWTKPPTDWPPETSRSISKRRMMRADERDEMKNKEAAQK